MNISVAFKIIISLQFYCWIIFEFCFNFNLQILLIFGNTFIYDVKEIIYTENGDYYEKR